MNFITEILFGTPEDKKKAKDGTDDGEELEEMEEEEEEQERATVPPRRSFVRNPAARSRSLSRVYNQVPRGRPTARQAQMDIIEYYAHLAMLETDPRRVKLEDENLRDAMQGCTPRPYGRLYSRLQIASLCISIGALETPEPARNEDDREEQTTEPSAFTSAILWKQMHQQLKLVKDLMLRSDANIMVPVQRSGYNDTDIAPENDAIDTELEKHEMFQDTYREVLVLVKVQEIMAKLSKQLVDTSSDTEQVIRDYHAALGKLFEKLGTIPAELTKFLATTESSTPIPATLLKDTLAIICDEESVYSYAQLKMKMRAVLTKWAESILEIPTLVRLGYGGVMSILDADEDDVSSYGVDEEQLLTQKSVEDDAARANKQQRTSFVDLPSQPLPSKSPRNHKHSVVRKNGDDNTRNKHLPSKSPRFRNITTTQNPSFDDDSNTQDPHMTPNKRPRNAVAQKINENGDPTEKRQRTSPQDEDYLWEDPRQQPTKQRTYLDWTEDETNAVREGYAMFGKRWAMIKHNSQNRLSRRTNVQIKDKFRTMLKRGEIKETPEKTAVV